MRLPFSRKGEGSPSPEDIEPAITPPFTADYVRALSDEDLVQQYVDRQSFISDRIKIRDRREAKAKDEQGSARERARAMGAAKEDQVDIVKEFGNRAFHLLRTEIDRRHREKRLSVPLPPTMGELEEGK